VEQRVHHQQHVGILVRRHTLQPLVVPPARASVVGDARSASGAAAPLQGPWCQPRLHVRQHGGAGRGLHLVALALHKIPDGRPDHLHSHFQELRHDLGGAAVGRVADVAILVQVADGQSVGERLPVLCHLAVKCLHHCLWCRWVRPPQPAACITHRLDVPHLHQLRHQHVGQPLDALAGRRQVLLGVIRRGVLQLRDGVGAVVDEPPGDVLVLGDFVARPALGDERVAAP